MNVGIVERRQVSRIETLRIDLRKNRRRVVSIVEFSAPSAYFCAEGSSAPSADGRG